MAAALTRQARLRLYAAIASAAATAASFPLALADDSAYLRALHVRRAPAAPATSVSFYAPPPRAPVDVGGVNRASRALRSAVQAGAPATSGEALYLAAATSGAAAPPAPIVTPVRTSAHAAALGAEIAVVGITRGAHPAVAAAVCASLAAAAATPHGSEFSWFVIDDATPRDVVKDLERALRISVPPDAFGSDEGAVPVIALLPRAASSRSKFLMPPSAHAGEGDGEESSGIVASDARAASFPTDSSSGSDTSYPPLSPLDAASLACVPYASEVADFCQAFASGVLEPTLLGEDRPTNDAHPHLPHVSVVTSSSWKDIVLARDADVVLEAYLEHCPMCKCLAPRLAMLGQVCAQHLPPAAPRIRVCVMNVDENERPLEWMPGPAFPTVQLFNKGTGSFSKARGPTCDQGESRVERGGSFATKTVLNTSVVAARNTSVGTPSCVPSVDFTHPTVRGKMALPTVTELVAWVAAHCSVPFDVSAVRVPAASLHSRAGSEAPWAAYFGSGSTGTAAAVVGEEETMVCSLESGAGEGGDKKRVVCGTLDASSGDVTIPLLTLLSDMDAEVRVFEAATFDSFYFRHLTDTLTAAAAELAPLTPAAAEDAVLLAARAHAAKQRAHVLGGGDIRTYAPKDGPVPSLGALPGVSAAAAAALPALRAATEALEAAAGACAYGNADAAWAATEAASDVAEGVHARELARVWLRDGEETRVIAAALPLAIALAAENV